MAQDGLIPVVTQKNGPKNSRNLTGVTTNQPGGKFRGVETQQLQLINQNSSAQQQASQGGSEFLNTVNVQKQNQKNILQQNIQHINKKIYQMKSGSQGPTHEGSKG
jgi:hypothetical protein